MTLADVAAATGIDTGQLSRIERGMQVSLGKAAILASFFGDAISEMEILYPDRFAEPRQKGRLNGRSRKAAARKAAQ